MNDSEKFEGFKQKLVDENEQKYGKEAREKYGDKTVDDTNSRLMGLNENQYSELEKLTGEVNNALKEAFETGDPKGEKARKACELHKKWLCFFWGEEKYNSEAHKDMGKMYVCDERFRAYYDKIAPGCAQFLCDALEAFCDNK